MMLRIVFLMFLGRSILAENCSTNSVGYNLLLEKFQELQVEVKQQGEKLLKGQEKISQDLLEQSREILEQQKAYNESNLELSPKKNPSNTNRLTKITSCKDEQSKISGRYRMKIPGAAPFEVYCEQQFYGGGWIVIQNRFNGSVDFYRNWTEYKEGFGSVSGEFWLGLERIHAIYFVLLQLTKWQPRELLVHLEDHSGNVKYAKFSSFAIGSESEKYFLKTVDGHSGTLGDSLKTHKGMKFSTRDSDNDVYVGNCAESSHGAWWYMGCHVSNLNGMYKTQDSDKRMSWYMFQSKDGLKVSKMMIK